MTPSIRTFLLINLLLSVTLITSLAIIGNLFLAHKDIQIQLDAQLIRTAEQMRAFFSDYGHQRVDFALIQNNLLNIETETQKQIPNLPISSLRLTREQREELQATKEATSSLELQIWNNQGGLILHSANTPAIPLSNGKNGLSTLWL